MKYSIINQIKNIFKRDTKNRDNKTKSKNYKFSRSKSTILRNKSVSNDDVSNDDNIVFLNRSSSFILGNKEL